MVTSESATRRWNPVKLVKSMFGHCNLRYGLFFDVGPDGLDAKLSARSDGEVRFYVRRVLFLQIRD